MKQWPSVRVWVVLMLAATAVSGCGSDSSPSAPASATVTSQNREERQNEEFLALLDKQGVLSAKPDADLVAMARETVCTQDTTTLSVHGDLVMAELRGVNGDPSLSRPESEVVLQAALKVFCPEKAPGNNTP
ncbi:DUF732 domain-containing protein [Streptomyces scabiei]|uniref:DUF732 domain-containing protein n=1 Tax=Streptomyces scabiei TaxID=1930 RepID=UPI0033F1C3F0